MADYLFHGFRTPHEDKEDKEYFDKFHPHPRKNYYNKRHLNPDSALHEFGDPVRFTAFVWILDKTTGKVDLFNQPGNKYHTQGSMEGGELYAARDLDDDNHVGIFGRFGESARGGGFVTVWETRSFGKFFKDATDKDTKTMLLGFLGKSPMEIHGQSPAKLPIDSDYIFSKGDGAEYVKDVLGDNVQDNTSEMEVSGYKVKSFEINALIGALHTGQGANTSFAGQMSPYQVAAFISSIDTEKYPQYKSLVPRAKEILAKKEILARKQQGAGKSPEETQADIIYNLVKPDPHYEIPKKILNYWNTASPEVFKLLKQKFEKDKHFESLWYSVEKELKNINENFTFGQWFSLRECCASWCLS